MGLFSRNPNAEPSYSRAWLAQTGGAPRKAELSLAIVARLVRSPIAEPSAWGHPLDDGSPAIPMEVFEGAVGQDYSLTRHVARDVTLLFTLSAGLADNRAAALESVGLDPAAVPGGVAAEALAVARTIEARSNGGEASTADLSTYCALYEDRSEAGHRRAIQIGSWSGIVVARLATAGRLENGVIFFGDGIEQTSAMEGVGWYPNPVNAGDTSGGDASIERWWDGADWTDRARIRDGRRWNEIPVPLFTTPSN